MLNIHIYIYTYLVIIYMVNIRLLIALRCIHTVLRTVPNASYRLTAPELSIAWLIPSRGDNKNQQAISIIVL